MYFVINTEYLKIYISLYFTYFYFPKYTLKIHKILWTVVGSSLIFK